MTPRLLPNYFKKIGGALFLITMLPNFIKAFWEGFTGRPEGYFETRLAEYSLLGIPLTQPFFYSLSVLSVIGLLIYALSKDKVFDEFLLKLRMEAMHLTFFFSVIIIFALLLFDIKSQISALFIVELQVLIFLITQKIKKVNIQPPVAKSHE